MQRLYNIYGSQGTKLVKRILKVMDLDLAAGMKVGIKPNLVLAKESSSGATTDPNLVAGVIEYLQEQGIEKITIMESAWVGAETEKVFEVCGYRELAAEYGVELYNLETDSTASYSTGEFELELFQKPRTVDYLINMPVLKAHCQTKMTCALKNLKGCIPDSEKRRFHTLGLHRPIAHLNSLLASDLIIVDGIIGDLTFEEGGNPVAMNRVVAGKDAVLVDSFVANLLGFGVEEISYIAYAEKLGLGSTDLKGAEIVNLNRSSEEQDGFSELMTAGAQKIARLAEYIQEQEACSACLGSLIHALQRIKDSYGLPNEAKVYIGQGFQEQEVEGIGSGSCLHQAESCIQGCPPTAKEIVDHLEKVWNL
ncbi:DUF362 domain-containing protein [Fuchsiella alkaliacetigena]|uniref:DUF362 domain-containing protein n=1 Tax=Fuchsiella alkaliacetigena TaxID=957042 RepID=UPI00200A35D0|nr:DUF362 domain-containing protein [Fuchsiella alkaliacetigena]MCK8824658.1 DUF362 domain-containing protein [Fuchsiella alkaliacetigena]